MIEGSRLPFTFLMSAQGKSYQNRESKIHLIWSIQTTNKTQQLHILITKKRLNWNALINRTSCPFHPDK